MRSDGHDGYHEGDDDGGDGGNDDDDDLVGDADDADAAPPSRQPAM